MKYLSVCSGIEAATVAWHHMGWKPVGFSEIEPFPSKVLAHHYPDVTNFGDMTKFKEWKLDDTVELLVGGTPCQSFSVAGLRKGLADPRGNLMLTYLAMANHFKPKWLLWENVPGVLSSNRGHDFAALLQGMAECGYGFAYRVLDAQYFGVPQRRRRVFVVGCLGDWRSAAKVLFESESLCGDITPRRGEGKEVAPTITRGFGDRGYDLNQIAGGGYKVDFPQDTVGALDTECGFQKASHQSINQGHILALNKDEEPLNPHVNGTITTRTGRSQSSPEEVVIHPFREADLHNYKETDVAGTLKASGGVLAGGSETFLTQLSAYNITFCDANGTRKDRPDGGLYVNETDTSNTLTRAGIGTNVVQAVDTYNGTIQGDVAYGFTQVDAARDIGKDISPTLRSGGDGGYPNHSVAYAVDTYNGSIQGDVACTLTSASGVSNASGPKAMVFQQNTRDEVRYVGGDGQIAGALMADAGMKQQNYIHLAAGFLPGQGSKAQGLGYEVEMAPTLRAGCSSYGLHQSMRVRRLTPKECERLQGFPDDYTNIPSAADTGRYKALGNSMAVPVMRWIGERINEVENGRKTD